MRVTWIQPEDIVRHELVQSRAEGKAVDDIATRWVAAGGTLDVPLRGASPIPATPAQRALARSLIIELDSRLAPKADDEPDGLEAIRAQWSPIPGLPPVDPAKLADRVRGGWYGRAVGCLLGKPVEGLSRAGIREILTATGGWPLAAWFTAEGLPAAVAARHPWNKASAQTSLAENIDGMPEDDDLNYTLLALTLVERTGRGFTTDDVATGWLRDLPGLRVFTAERAVYRNLLDGVDPANAATVANPYREWIGAQIRADLYGWICPGDPAAAAELAWRDARLSHTRNGVYGAMFVAAMAAAACVADDIAAVIACGRSVVPPRSRLARAIDLGFGLGGRAVSHEDAVDTIVLEHEGLHWVHVLGGYDAMLWHTYPLIGIDQRDQFDLSRDIPGLAKLVSAFQTRGIRVFLEYQNWDTGGRTDRDDPGELVALVGDSGADGIFLDTMREAPPGVRDALDRTGGIALEGESNIPVVRIADHEMSWAQWQADSGTPGVLRAKWFEQRHMLHQTRRWDRDRTPQLRTAWLNGAGMLVWENVFGSWVGWSPRDCATWSAMLAVLRRYARHFSHGEWTPLADPADEVAPSLWASRFSVERVRLWTVAGRDGHALGPGDAIVAETRDGDRWFELLAGREVEPVIRGRETRVTLPPSDRAFAAILAVPAAHVDPAFRAFLATRAAQVWSDDPRSPVRTHRRIPAGQGSVAGAGLLQFPGGARSIEIRYRLRETGMYGGAPFSDLWKPLPPILHRIQQERHDVAFGAFAIAPTEVTNAEFARFITASGYRPTVTERLLVDWSEGWAGEPRQGTEDEPVRHVGLDDARAYARWAGLRLPTEFEWQVAAMDPRFRRGEPLVWNWTESEHTDGRTRYAILKGGSRAGLVGSDWYTDAGPQPPEVSLKYLRAGPAIERSAAIGFRCAADILAAHDD